MAGHYTPHFCESGSFSYFAFNLFVMKISLLLLFVLVLLVACTDVKEPVFENVENLKIGKLNLAETDLSADLRFTNANNFGLKLKTLDCDLYLDSSFLGHFSNTEPVKIPARSAFLLPLSGQARTLLLMEQTRKAFAGKESHVRVEGKARVGRSGFYKTIPINYTDTLLIKY